MSDTGKTWQEQRWQQSYGSSEAPAAEPAPVEPDPAPTEPDLAPTEPDPA